LQDVEIDDSFIPLLHSLNPSAKPAAEAEAAAPAAAGTEGRKPGFKPPWLPRLCRFGSPLLRLHNEVVAFCRMLEPTAEEVESRSRSMRTVREVVHSIWPQVSVAVVG
jgi:non-canonical poly(A) RNA polymerase PAPD5/7